ncbi:MAG: hypothetical protein SFW08_00780 [Gemmatimonadaceae bacterium]|nr:hypothetical protein [Gemmatimonadaceae bacterium]
MMRSTARAMAAVLALCVLSPPGVPAQSSDAGPDGRLDAASRRFRVMLHSGTFICGMSGRVQEGAGLVLVGDDGRSVPVAADSIRAAWVSVEGSRIPLLYHRSPSRTAIKAIAIIATPMVVSAILSSGRGGGDYPSDLKLLGVVLAPIAMAVTTAINVFGTDPDQQWNRLPQFGPERTPAEASALARQMTAACRPW